MIQGRKAVEQFGQLELLREFNQTLPSNRSSFGIHSNSSISISSSTTPTSLTLTPPPSRNSPVGVDYFTANLHQLTLLSHRDQQKLLHNRNSKTDNFNTTSTASTITTADTTTTTPTAATETSSIWPQSNLCGNGNDGVIGNGNANEHQHNQRQHQHQQLHLNLISSINARQREFDPVVGSGRPAVSLTTTPNVPSSMLRYSIGPGAHTVNSRHTTHGTINNNSASMYQRNLNHSHNNNNNLLMSSPHHQNHHHHATNNHYYHQVANGSTPNYNQFQKNVNGFGINNPSGCPFCRRNNESEAVVMSHRLRDDQGRVTCPQLKKHKCEICGATGEQAHTRSYCHHLKNSRDSPLMIGFGSSVKELTPNMSCVNNSKYNAAGKLRHR